MTFEEIIPIITVVAAISAAVWSVSKVTSTVSVLTNAVQKLEVAVVQLDRDMTHQDKRLTAVEGVIEDVEILHTLENSMSVYGNKLDYLEKNLASITAPKTGTLDVKTELNDRKLTLLEKRLDAIDLMPLKEIVVRMNEQGKMSHRLDERVEGLRKEISGQLPSEGLRSALYRLETRISDLERKDK